MKNFKAKLNLTKTLGVFLSICLLLSVFTVMHFVPTSARAATEYTDTASSVSISQSQFDANTSTSPVTPSNWTGGYAGNLSGKVTSGIISLDSNYTKNYDKLDLDVYPEFKDKNKVPGSPFGTSNNNVFPGTTKNVLMVNNLSNTAYGYDSQSITLEANSYYKFSVWVKTGSFGADQGAAVTLKGLAEPVGIWNIDTADALNGAELNAANKFGFIEQVIYIGTGPNSESVNLRLSVGDYADADHYFASKGYAFFANVSLSKLSPTAFNRETAQKSSGEFLEIYDMNPVSEDALLRRASDNLDIGSFTFEGNKIEGWSKISNEDEPTDALLWDIYDGGDVFVKGLDGFGFTADPFSPGGKYDPVHKTEGSNHIMVLSSANGAGGFNNVSAGIKSADITIEAEKYYRLSAWYNTQEEAGAAIKISGQGTSYSNENKLGPFSTGSISTDNNTARYGWQRSTFYIKGSAFESVNINVELWLGDDNKTSGIAMFDDITLEDITFEEYNENKFGGTQVTIDVASSSTSITNGDFVEMDYVADSSYPLAPSGWTYIDPTTAGTTGQSDRALPSDNIIKGVTPTHETHYENNIHNYDYIQNPRPFGSTYNNVNVLLMASSDKTAFGYRSSAITISGGSDHKITVSLLTKLTGSYGAALLLKNGNNIVSSIERIHTSSPTQFQNYSFYVAGGADSTELTLEIWFGMTDKGSNNTKLSSGHMFVGKVDMETLTAGDSGVTELNEKLNEYNTKPLEALNFAVYRLGAFDFNAYDRFSTDAVKPMYDMSLTSSNGTLAEAGLIAGTMPAGYVLPDNFEKAHKDTVDAAANVVMLRNKNNGYSRYSANSTLNLTAGSYYKIDFSLFVELNEESASRSTAIGAGVWLDSYGLKNIRNTYDPVPTQDVGGVIIEKLQFTTFSFYYAVGDADKAVEWAITLGGNEYTNQGIAGSVFLNSIKVTEIDPTTYESEVGELTEDDEYYVLAIDGTTATEDTEPEDTDDTDDTDNTTGGGGGGGNNWMLIPSILFAVAIIIALVGVAIKMLLARRPKHKNKEKVVSYDRNETLKATSTTTKTEDGETVVTPIMPDTTYDEFDETDTPAATKPTTHPTPTAATIVEPTTTEETTTPKTPTETTPEAVENEFDD